MKFHCIIADNRLEFGSRLAEHRFYELKGSPVIIEIDSKASAEMRRFFEGAVVPAIFYQHPRSGWRDFRECREALKLEFLPTWTRTLRGEVVQTPRSSAALSKESFRSFIERIQFWMQENGLEFPDPSEYKAWRDSGPLKGEVFPPLGRLITRYKQKLG